MADVIFKPPYPTGKQQDTKAPKQDFFLALMTYGRRIVVDHEESGAIMGTNTLYTVPAGKTFFLFHGTICLTGNGNLGVEFGIMQIKNGTLAYGLLDVQVNLTAAGSQMSVTSQFSPALPVIMASGEYIEILNSSATGTSTTGTIYGYEIDTALLPNLFG